MSIEDKKTTIERLSFEFASIFDLLEEAYDSIYREDHNGVLFSVIAPLNMVLRDLSDLSDRVAQNGFASREGRINRKFGGDLVSHVVESLAYVVHESVELVWAKSLAKSEDWKCFDRVSYLLEKSCVLLKNLALTIKKDFE